MTVYVPQEVMRKAEGGVFLPKFNLFPAETFGEVVVVLDAGPVAMAAQRMVANLRAALKDFGDNDYILPMGDPVAIGAAISIAAEFNMGRVQVLKWRGKQHAYTVLKMNLRGNRYVD